ncbi:MAG: phosphoglycerate kinase [Chromatiales bacterium]|nr:phosphoglycerate kinase [Chromatiales bacterium]
MALLRMEDLPLAGKRVLMRLDLNVPVEGGVVTSDARIRAALPTIRLALERGAAVMLMSHLGRPVEGQFDARWSLTPVARHLSMLLGRPVAMIRDWLHGFPIADGEVALCENVRFNPGEKADDDRLGRQMAALCDVFVMDAFGTAHRAQASTHAVARHAPVACAGPLLLGELDALGRALRKPARPVVAILGGSKASTKLKVLQALLGKVDYLIPGGGIANTFLAAAGHPVGRSLCEHDYVGQLAKLLSSRERAEVVLPRDVITAREVSARSRAHVRRLAEVGDEEMILDVGPATARAYARLLKSAGTIVWNGPVGVFEIEQFGGGTRALAKAVAASPAFSIAGGGDTLAALDRYRLTHRVSYVSTGGGAFLEYLEGVQLPAVTVLEERAEGRR